MQRISMRQRIIGLFRSRIVVTLVLAFLILSLGGAAFGFKKSYNPGEVQAARQAVQEQVTSAAALRDGLEKAQGLAAQGAASSDALQRLGAGLQSLGSRLRRSFGQPGLPPAAAGLPPVPPGNNADEPAPAGEGQKETQ